MIDTHCHLFMSQFDADREAVFDNARRAGVKAFISVGIDEPTSEAAIALAESHPDVYASVGLHPHSAHEAPEDTAAQLEKLARSSKKVVAVGEVGLDYFKSEAPPEVQRRVFGTMVDLAARLGLPLIVHSRDAFNDTFDILKQGKAAKRSLSALFHCFSYDAVCMKRAIEEGFDISFAGNLTFPNAKALKEAAKEVPLDRFVIETDAPYLAPQSMRGKRNEPSYLTFLISEIAALKGIAPEDAARAATRNAQRIFKLPS